MKIFFQTTKTMVWDTLIGYLSLWLIIIGLVSTQTVYADAIAPGNGMEHMASNTFTYGAYTVMNSQNTSLKGINPNYTTFAGFDVEHMQSVVRLRNDKDGNAYFLYAHSHDDGGYLWIVRVDEKYVHGDKYNTDANGVVIMGEHGQYEGKPVWGIRLDQNWWTRQFPNADLEIDGPTNDNNNYNSYNHPCGLGSLPEEGICSVALQNFGAMGHLEEGPMEGSGDAVGFLDVNPLIDEGKDPVWKGIYLVENLVKKGDGTTNPKTGGWYNSSISYDTGLPVKEDNYNDIDHSHIVKVKGDDVTTTEDESLYLIAFGEGQNIYHFLSKKPYLQDYTGKVYSDTQDDEFGQKYLGFTPTGEGTYIKSETGIWYITASDENGKSITSKKVIFCTSGDNGNAADACPTGDSQDLPDENTVRVVINVSTATTSQIEWSDNDLNWNDGLTPWDAGNCGKTGTVYVHPETGQTALYCSKLTTPENSITAGYQIFDSPALIKRNNKLYWDDYIEIRGFQNYDYHMFAAPGNSGQGRHYQINADMSLDNVKASLYQVKCPSGKTCDGPVKYGDLIELKSVFTNEATYKYFLTADGYSIGNDVVLNSLGGDGKVLTEGQSKGVGTRFWIDGKSAQCLYDNGDGAIYPTPGNNSGYCYQDRSKFIIRPSSVPFWPQFNFFPYDSRSLHYWKMDKGEMKSGINIKAPLTSDWHIEGIGYIDNDDAADIVRQHDSGQVHYWKIENGEMVSGDSIYPGNITSDWSIKGVGDVDGDGTDDIVWQHDSGRVHYWKIANGKWYSSHDIHPDNITSDWSIKGVGDVDGDGTDDIVWQHDSGRVHYWKIANGKWYSSHDIHPDNITSDWSIKGVGDIDGDGTDDIVWQHDTGQVHYWKIKNGKWVSGLDISTPVGGTQWSIKGVGDVDGDGTDDIIWQFN
ncbi:MAG: hypothetical protein GY710_01390 [Desulfobacteraceae bacterium]|nr:hypothetical protein [Desulfobacteraceae bacterium]